MKVDGYILTGLHKLRNASHSPIILDYGSSATLLDLVEAGDRHSNFENFHIFPVSKAALRCITRTTGTNSRKVLSIDDFSVWPRHSMLGGPIICTENDFFLAKPLESLTKQGILAVRALYTVLDRPKPRFRSFNGFGIH